MNKEVGRRAICAVLAGGLTFPIGHAAYGVELYARAIGDPYAYQPEPAPARTPDSTAPVPATSEPEPPTLPGLGSEDAATPSTAESGWSWGRILVGVAIVGAMAALANKSGGGQVSVSSDTGGAAPPSSGDTGSGDSGVGTVPLPTVPTVGDDDDGDDDRKGKKKK